MSSAAPKHIGVIIGSTRVGRVGDKVAQFVKDTIESSNLIDKTTELALVDLAAFNLPVFNETKLPAQVQDPADFAQEHSRAWNTEIGKFDAYIIVSGEYNFGVPGGLKNAIDYLYHQWIGKPVLIVTYGIFGGNNASDSLKQTLSGMHLQVVETRPQFAFPDRDAANRNMSPGLIAAIGGKLDPGAKDSWTANKDDLLKGFGELKEKLHPKPSA